MTITEVSKKYNLTQDTIRYYEKVGMIPPVPRTSSGIRDFDEESCLWLDLAKCLRAAGLPVEMVAEYVRLFREGGSTMQARYDLLNEQKKRLEEQKNVIENALSHLKAKVGLYEKAMKDGVVFPEGK